jgi:hypothetical protein
MGGMYNPYENSETKVSPEVLKALGGLTGSIMDTSGVADNITYGITSTIQQMP